MSDQGNLPTAEEAFGVRPGGPAPKFGNTLSKEFPSAEEAFGPKGGASPQTEQESKHPFLMAPLDIGAAAWADFTRKGNQPDGSSTPALDHYFDRTPAGQVLKAFGQDVASPFHALSELTNTDNGEGLDFIKKSGTFKQWEKNHAASAAYFRNSLMRSSAEKALDVSPRSPMIVGGNAIGIAHGMAAGIHSLLTFPERIGYGEGVSGAFEQLRKGLLNESEDLSQLKGQPWEAKLVPYLRKYVSESGGPLGKGAAGAFDAFNLGLALVGIPQLAGKTVHEISAGFGNALDAAWGPDPAHAEQIEAWKKEHVAQLEAGINFGINLVGPVVGGLGTAVPAHAAVMRRLDAAKKAGVIGSQPMTFNDSALGLKAAQAREAAEMKAATAQEPAPAQPQDGIPSPTLQASETPAAAQATEAAKEPPPDVHTVARELAPETFTRYDPLLARHRWYTNWINELRAARDNDPRLERAQAEIDDILAKVNGQEERLTNRQRQRIEDIRGGMEDFKAADSPDMIRVKQEMLRNYQELAEVQPQVQAAYRRAAEQLARDGAERGVEVPVQLEHPVPEEVPPAPAVRPGMVRMYHGGVNYEPGQPLWFTSHLPKAKGYAEKAGGGRVQFVDLPEDHPLIAPEYPEQSVARGFTVERELPTELADQRQAWAEPVPETPGTGRAPAATTVPQEGLPPESAHVQTVADIAEHKSRELQAAGMSKEMADASAAVVASHYDARARRFGGQLGTAAELYRREASTVQGEVRPAKGQRTFAQKALTKAQEIAKQVPGLRQLLPDLTETERNTLTKGMAENLIEAFKKVPKAEEVASVAFSGRAKRGWYRNAADAIHRLFGADSDRFSALLAAMSPQTPVESNLVNALKTWVNWDKEGRPTDHAAIKRIMGASVEGTGGEASVLDAWVNNSIRALTAEDPGALNLSGPKVNSFMLNLRGYVDEVTNDAWMATYAALDPKEFASRQLTNKVDKIGKSFGHKSPGYMAMSAIVRRAAKILTERTGETWTPAEVQETVWSWAKALYERRDRAGEDRTTKEILKAADLTHEDVQGASDFASLLVRGVYGKILEEGGYGPELEQLRGLTAERRAADQPTGPAVSVTAAEGSGLEQLSYERHLQQAAGRLERVRNSRLADGQAPTRTLAREANAAEIKANMSAATPSIPGIQRLADMANEGDVAAGRLVNLIAHDSLNRLMSGIEGVDLKVNYNGGLYGGSLEPSVGIEVGFPEKQRGPVLAALAKFADNFNQEQIHVRQPTIDEPGRVNTDGSYATPVYRIQLKTPLTREEVQQAIDTSGLYGLTFNDKAVEAYYVGNPRDAAARKEFHDKIEKLVEYLGEGVTRVGRSTERLWAYGRGNGATAGYDAIAGELPAGTDQHTQVPRALAEHELGRELTPAEQAAEITPAQRQLQERIATHYEDLPDDDLQNALVVRAYDALTRVVSKQLEGLPIKYEAWADRQPDGSWAARGGEPYKNSAAMRADVLNNNHMWFYITEPGQFGPPGVTFHGHPMLEQSGFKASNGYPMLQNDAFRVVHDYYGHLTSPVSFGPKGEEAAWRNHMATMDDPWARWALTSETRGQNSWVNFGSHVDPESGLSERPFARQKAALLPIEDSFTGDDMLDLPMLELQRDLTPTQARGSLPEDTYFQSNKEPSLRPAVNFRGKTYVSDTADHFGALDKIPLEFRQQATLDGDNRGFVNERGRYLNREKAMDYARDYGLLNPRYAEWGRTALELPTEWLKKPDELLQGKDRGSITFRNNAPPIIRLMKNGDASTFMHETGHEWLEELFRDAKHEAAPDELKRDAQTVREWLGAKEGEAITRAQHEKWARGFERYLMEGVAPSQKLAGIFAKFKRWLTQLYQTATRLRSPINDEIRGVMDRLVASPEGPTVIAEPRNTAHVMADVHEVESASAQPQYAAAAADHIDREVENQLRRVAPEEYHALLRTEGQNRTVPGTRPAPGSRGVKAKPVGEPAGGDQAPSAFPAGGDQAAPAGGAVGAAADEGGGNAAGPERGGAEQPADRSAGNGESAEPGRGRGGLEFIEGTGPRVASEFAINMEARALAAGMPEDFFGDMPQHRTMSRADQALKAVQLLHDDPDRAWRIAMVDEDPPSGVMRATVVKAIEQKARAERDWETIRQLGTNQKLADERTQVGRELAAMAEFDPSDPVAAVRVVQKARAAKVAKRAQPNEVKEMRKEIRAAKSPKSAWVALAEEWKCK